MSEVTFGQLNTAFEGVYAAALMNPKDSTLSVAFGALKDVAAFAAKQEPVLYSTHRQDWLEQYTELKRSLDENSAGYAKTSAKEAAISLGLEKRVPRKTPNLEGRKALMQATPRKSREVTVIKAQETQAASCNPVMATLIAVSAIAIVVVLGSIN